MHLDRSSPIAGSDGGRDEMHHPTSYSAHAAVLHHYYLIPYLSISSREFISVPLGTRVSGLNVKNRKLH